MRFVSKFVALWPQKYEKFCIRVLFTLMEILSEIYLLMGDPSETVK